MIKHCNCSRTFTVWSHVYVRTLETYHHMEGRMKLRQHRRLLVADPDFAELHPGLSVGIRHSVSLYHERAMLKKEDL